MYPTNPSLTSSDDGRYEIRKEYCQVIERMEVSTKDASHENARNTVYGYKKKNCAWLCCLITMANALTKDVLVAYKRTYWSTVKY
jgi:hypothetical protein